MNTAMNNNTDSHAAEVRKHLTRNYTLHSIEGGLYMAGLFFTAFETVMPPVIKALGGSAWMISIIPMMTTIGVSLPALFVLNKLERLRWKKPIVTYNGIFQRLPYLIAGLALIFLAIDYPRLTLWMVLLCPLCSGFACGLSFPAWMELVAKTVPPERRASLFAVRLIIASAFGLLAGYAIDLLLGKFPGTTGYGILHIITFIFLTGSFIFFVFIKETDIPPVHGDKEESLPELLKSCGRIIAEDKNFKVFLISRFLASGMFITIPFMSIYALNVLNESLSYTGHLVIASIFGAISGNLFSAYFGDKYGARHLLMLSTGGYALLFPASIMASSKPEFFAVFFFIGFFKDSMSVANGTLSAELPPWQQRIRYLTTGSAILAPSMIAVTFIATMIWQASNSYTAVACAGSGVMITAYYFASKIKEPRKIKDFDITPSPE